MVTQPLDHVLRPDRVGGGVGVWRTPRHNPYSGFRLPFHSWDLTNLHQAQEPRLAHLAHLRRISNDRPFDRFIYQRSLPLWWGYYARYRWLSVPFLIFFFWMMTLS